jgi:hypothetical protein
MWTRVRPRLTYANVIASVALFIVLAPVIGRPTRSAAR